MPFLFIPEEYPEAPGCYVMKDRHSRILYVGKSKNLRKRLSSYFQPHSKSNHTARLVSSIADIEIILVNTETESFLLENNLIAKHRPAFNRLIGRADKGYPYIVLTDELYPRLVPYQAGHPNKDLGDAPVRQSFGPFLSHRFCLGVLEIANDLFELRTCSHLADEICLRYHIKQCSGCCERRVSSIEYARQVEHAVQFLSSKPVQLIAQMRELMFQYSENMAFEGAQRLKKLIAVLEGAMERQLIERNVEHNQAVVYLCEEGALIACIERGSLVAMNMWSYPERIFSGDAFDELVWSICSDGNVKEMVVNLVEGLKLPEEMNGCCIRLAQIPIEESLLELCKMNYQYRMSKVVKNVG